jgi:hypothetical protein
MDKLFYSGHPPIMSTLDFFPFRLIVPTAKVEQKWPPDLAPFPFSHKRRKNQTLPPLELNGKKMAAVPTSDFNEPLLLLKKFKPFLLESKKKDGRHFHQKILFFQSLLVA